MQWSTSKQERTVFTDRTCTQTMCTATRVRDTSTGNEEAAGEGRRGEAGPSTGACECVYPIPLWREDNSEALEAPHLS